MNTIAPEKLRGLCLGEPLLDGLRKRLERLRTHGEDTYVGETAYQALLFLDAYEAMLASERERRG